MGGNRGALRAGQHVLVTGHRALVGRAVVDALRDAGLIVVGLDLADGDDITDPATVRERIQGCVGVVHLAAADDEPDKPDPLTPATVGGVDQVMATNVGGADCRVGYRPSPEIRTTLPVIVTTKAVSPMNSNVTGRSRPETTLRN